METKVIDASVIIKWYVNEQNYQQAQVIREQYINKKIELIVPPILFFEVLNGLKYSGEFNKEELNIIGESLENYGFNVIMPKNDIRTKMINIALDYDLTIYDASYIALAIQKKTQLITADEKIKKKIPNELKKHVVNLADQELM